MTRTLQERGQALILIVFGMVGLIALVGLAVDGGMAYSNRRVSQNTADYTALAAALAYAKGEDPVAAAQAAANANGFNNNGTTNTVDVSQVDATDCPHSAPGKIYTVHITSHLTTYFSPVLGIRELTNDVQAVSESCGTYIAPMFPGNAIIALTPNSTGFNAQGTPSWEVTGGGIFSNSSSSSSVNCGGNAGLESPSVTVVGGASLGCHHVVVGSTTTHAEQVEFSDYSRYLPRVPACDGTATLVSGTWVAQSGADGSRVAWSGSPHFGPGLFCITNSPGPFHGDITGTGVTFYIMPNQFNIKFNGGGNITATAPTAGEYAGVLIFSGAQTCSGELLLNQSIDFRGNGSGDIRGSIIVPSATVTMYGNSNSNGFHTQIIAYQVDSGGNADNVINYQAGENYQVTYPAWLTLLK